VPARVAAGSEIEYHICVENRSQAEAHHVLVRNPVPAAARFVRADPEPNVREPELRWQLGTLPAGTFREIILVLMPAGTSDVDNCARVQYEHGQCVHTRVARPSLRVQKSGPAQAVLYDALTFQLTVTNSGDAEAEGVVLTDTLPAGLEPVGYQNPLSWNIGTLAPGQSRSVEYHAVAKAAGGLCNRASVTAAGGIHEVAESCIHIGEAKIALAATGPARRYVHIPAAYQLTVTNAGDAPLAEVVVANPVPAKTSFVSAGQGGQLSGSEVQWTLGTLAPAEVRTLDLTLKGEQAGLICNRATARAARGLTAQAEACTEFLGVPALLLELVDTDDPVEVGSETSYIVSIRNQGTSDATNVRIEATVPEQLEVTRVEGSSDHRQEGQRLVFRPVTLQPRGQARYVIHAKALRPGDVRFKVDLNADQLTSGPVHEEESTTLYSDVAGGGRAPPGLPQLRRHHPVDAASMR
jgi:uncharacterized repeat protein (TIGR01451 family)